MKSASDRTPVRPDAGLDAPDEDALGGGDVLGLEEVVAEVLVLSQATTSPAARSSDRAAAGRRIDRRAMAGFSRGFRAATSPRRAAEQIR